MATASGPVLRIVDTRPEERLGGRFAARIRWRRIVDPDWEIDTRHLGFESWRQAACFANGLTEEGACALFLYEGVLVLQLVNGRDLIVEDSETVVWQREDPADARLPEDSEFIRTALDLGQLSAMGLDGAFSPMRFGVDDLRGSQRMDVRVEADARRRTVLVTLAVVGDGAEASGDALPGPLFDVPQA
jgi:hypothetical protein